jgi:hypothetical protein
MFDRLVSRLSGARFLTVSFLIHAVAIILLGGVVLYRAIPETPDFVGGSDGSLVDTTDNAASGPPDSTEAVPQDFTPPTPTLAPPVTVVTTVAPQTPTFVLPATPSALTSNETEAAKSAMASLGNHQAGAGGMSGMGAMGRAGGMARINFFGVKAEGRRIAFLVDYSGSMEGEFRREMEEELERSLKGLPNGTQMLIIPWAGGAWLYNEVATEISGKWEKIGKQFDNFAVRPGEKLAHPEWVPVNADNIRKLMKGMQAQKSWSGGTDWRSPFRYAMEANPPPDTIFFMTDGQIGDAKRAFEDIDTALKKSPRVPAVFALWIANKTFKADPLKTLAEKYRGEFRVIDANGKRPN